VVGFCDHGNEIPDPIKDLKMETACTKLDLRRQGQELSPRLRCLRTKC
jgi:hypothetical protein